MPVYTCFAKAKILPIKSNAKSIKSKAKILPIKSKAKTKKPRKKRSKTSELHYPNPFSRLIVSQENNLRQINMLAKRVTQNSNVYDVYKPNVKILQNKPESNYKKTLSNGKKTVKRTVN